MIILEDLQFNVAVGQLLQLIFLVLEEVVRCLQMLIELLLQQVVVLFDVLIGVIGEPKLILNTFQIGGELRLFILQILLQVQQLLLQHLGLSRFLDIEQLLLLVVEGLGVCLLFQLFQELLDLFFVGLSFFVRSGDDLVLPLNMLLQIDDLDLDLLHLLLIGKDQLSVF